MSIQVVWLKHDLRLQDHTAFCEAARLGSVLPVFTWDASVWSSPDYATQHVQFVRECLAELKIEMQAMHLDFFQSTQGILQVLNTLQQHNLIAALHSHEETGNQRTYALDIEVGKWCKAHNVAWCEYPQNGVVRC